MDVVEAKIVHSYLTNFQVKRLPSASTRPVVGFGKWIGITNVPVPAISSGTAGGMCGLLGIPVEDRSTSRVPGLQSMVHQIAGHDRSLSAGFDVDTAMAGRVTGRRRSQTVSSSV